MLTLHVRQDQIVGLNDTKSKHFLHTHSHRWLVAATTDGMYLHLEVPRDQALPSLTDRLHPKVQSACRQGRCPAIWLCPASQTGYQKVCVCDL